MAEKAACAVPQLHAVIGVQDARVWPIIYCNSSCRNDMKRQEKKNKTKNMKRTDLNRQQKEKDHNYKTFLKCLRHPT